MDSIRIPATERSPFVSLDVDSRTLTLKGESYPEDAAAFFGPLLAAFRQFLGSTPDQAVRVDLELTYFNSSSAKALMNLFQDLEAAAASGTPVTIAWHYHEDDDTMQEFGEDFALDMVHAHFDLCPRTEA